MKVQHSNFLETCTKDASFVHKQSLLLTGGFCEDVVKPKELELSQLFSDLGNADSKTVEKLDIANTCDLWTCLILNFFKSSI